MSFTCHSSSFEIGQILPKSNEDGAAPAYFPILVCTTEHESPNEDLCVQIVTKGWFHIRESDGERCISTHALDASCDCINDSLWIEINEASIWNRNVSDRAECNNWPKYSFYKEFPIWDENVDTHLNCRSLLADMEFPDPPTASPTTGPGSDVAIYASISVVLVILLGLMCWWKLEIIKRMLLDLWPSQNTGLYDGKISEARVVEQARNAEGNQPAPEVEMQRV